MEFACLLFIISVGTRDTEGGGGESSAGHLAL